MIKRSRKALKTLILNEKFKVGLNQGSQTQIHARVTSFKNKKGSAERALRKKVITGRSLNMKGSEAT